MYYYEDLILTADYNSHIDSDNNFNKNFKNLDQVFQESDQFGDDFKMYSQLKRVLCNALSYSIKKNIKPDDILIDENKYHELIESLVNIDYRKLFAFKKIEDGNGNDKYQLLDWIIIDKKKDEAVQTYLGFKADFSYCQAVCLWPPYVFEAKAEYKEYNKAIPGSCLFMLWDKISESCEPKSMEEASEKFTPPMGLM